MPAKAVIAQHPAHRDDIGELATRRPLPGPEIDQLDPFLFLNHHGPQTFPPGNRGLPFGPHPHRGFETVTFILDGELAHRDSAGHESVIRAGGVQWMTAGSGLVHAELSPEDFQREGGPLEILQLWVNLPARLKMTAPRYQGVQADALPALVSDRERAVVRLVAGTWGGQTGPVTSLTGIFMSLVELDAGGRVGFGSLAGRNVFLYVVRGQAQVNGVLANAWTLVQLDLDGDTVEIVGEEDTLLLFGHGKPIGEPVVAQGPFVMNTRQEILDAIRDYEAGLFEGVRA
jgi:redox-sensitive bicupin YhaK (pirin superfamily)